MIVMFITHCNENQVINHFYPICDKWSVTETIIIANIKTIFIPGLLAPVSNLITYTGSVSSIIISWSAPFSLDVTDVDPDIWYSVLIYNMTDEPTVISCTDCINIIETYYTFTPDYPSPCHKYILTIIPFNGAGQGQSSENVSVDSELT